MVVQVKRHGGVQGWFQMVVEIFANCGLLPGGPPLLRRLCPPGELRRGGDLLPLRDATGAPCAAGSEPWRTEGEEQGVWVTLW